MITNTMAQMNHNPAEYHNPLLFSAIYLCILNNPYRWAMGEESVIRIIDLHYSKNQQFPPIRFSSREKS